MRLSLNRNRHLDSKFEENEKEALRFNDGKIDLTYCPESLIAATAACFMSNAKEHGGKYPKNNWKLGMPYTKVLASLKRHIAQFTEGETIDEESGLPHTWHMACNIAMLIEYDAANVGTDNRGQTSGYKNLCAKFKEIKNG